ncbi:AEC family transporter [Neisseria bacilliformis]|uniref:AEC family transporter n=1 Tax=Neisseria bacilliformis TaxID=267212 RepID=UPI0006651F97|nr:AEC family transporter [Neisseria bacilliformis]
MQDVFNITAPVFLIIALGYGAVRSGAFCFEELRGAAKFVLKIGLPALVFFAIAGKPFREVFDAVYLAGYGLATFCAFAVGWLLMRLRTGDGVQAALGGFAVSFSNTGFIGYPILTMAVGEAAGKYFAMNVLVENMFLIPLFFLLADSAGGGGEKGRLKTALPVVANLLKNPIMLAQFAALPFALGWLPLPAALLKTASVLASGSAPVALFVIGGSLVGLKLGGRLGEILLLTAMKLVLFPLLTLLFLALLGAGRDMLFAGALLSCVPMASMVAIIHTQYGHEQRGAAVMLLTTVLSFAGISLVLLFGR